MSPTLYGLKNCDTCRKARRWLESAGVEHAFVDVRDQGVDANRLTGWAQSAGWQTLLNRRSRAWRELPEADRADLDETKATTLMHAHPTLIKRPVLETGNEVLIGFSQARYAAVLEDD